MKFFVFVLFANILTVNAFAASMEARQANRLREKIFTELGKGRIERLPFVEAGAESAYLSWSRKAFGNLARLTFDEAGQLNGRYLVSKSPFKGGFELMKIIGFESTTQEGPATLIVKDLSNGAMRLISKEEFETRTYSIPAKNNLHRFAEQALKVQTVDAMNRLIKDKAQEDGHLKAGASSIIWDWVNHYTAEKRSVYAIGTEKTVSATYVKVDLDETTWLLEERRTPSVYVSFRPGNGFGDRRKGDSLFVQSRLDVRAEGYWYTTIALDRNSGSEYLIAE